MGKHLRRRLSCRASLLIIFTLSLMVWIVIALWLLTW
jgi:hypothetical protein